MMLRIHVSSSFVGSHLILNLIRVNTSVGKYILRRCAARVSTRTHDRTFEVFLARINKYRRRDVCDQPDETECEVSDGDLSVSAYDDVNRYGSSTLCRSCHVKPWRKGEHVYTVSPAMKVHQAYAIVIEGNCQMKTMIQCLIPGVFLYRRITRCMRWISISGREETSSSSREGRSSSIDFVWMLVMMANMEHTSDPNHRASAIQIALLDRVQGRHEKAAPPQKVA
jgi:hypothetical protein